MKSNRLFTNTTETLLFRRQGFLPLLRAMYQEVLSENPGLPLSKENFENNLFDKLQEVVKEEISHGSYKVDEIEKIVISKPDRVSVEQEKEIKKDSRDFVRKLFSLCKDKQTFESWLEKDITFPKDALGLAVAANAKKFVFEHLCDSGNISNLDDEDKVDFLMRAKGRLNEEAFDYVKKVFSIDEADYNFR